MGESRKGFFKLVLTVGFVFPVKFLRFLNDNYVNQYHRFYSLKSSLKKFLWSIEKLESNSEILQHQLLQLEFNYGKHILWDYVQRTLQHPRFSIKFSKLGSIEKTFQLPWDLNTKPKLFALDTEMCIVQDDKGLTHRRAVKVSLIDEDGKVLLDEIIRPQSMIVDYKYEFTGLTEQDLQKVNYTHQNAKADIIRVLKSQKGHILVGHGIINDFRGLQLGYLPVIDTAILFCKDNGKECVFESLESLGKKWVGADQFVHDPLIDAQVSLDLVKHVCELGLRPWMQESESDDT